MDTLRRLWARVTRANEKRAAAVAGLRSTGFWCDEHWDRVERAGADPFIATANLTIGLMLAGEPPGKGWRPGCCKFTDETIAGAIERATA